MSQAKPTIAIYHRYFLSPSETFVYRQMQGVSGAFNPIVLTSEVRNSELYPVQDVYARPRTFAEKVGARLTRALTGRFTVVPSGQRRAWTQALRTTGTQLVHAHFGLYGLDMLGAAGEARTPLLVTFHGYDASSLLRDAAYAKELPGLFDRAHAITVSRDMADRLAAYGARDESLDVHYIGVPVENFDYVDRTPVAQKIAAGDPVRFVQVSNFVEKKGHRYTIEAFARYLPSHPGHELILAGDGPTREAAEALSRELGIADRVHFPGRVVKEQVSDLMRGADVFVHHSVTASDGDMEGIPTVIMEAMSMGLVVVSTRHSGIAELVEDASEGFLVAERDVDAYTERLEALAQCDPELPRRARRKIESSFNMDVQNDKLVDIYRKVIDD